MNTSTSLPSSENTTIPLSSCSLQTCPLSRSHFAYPPNFAAAEAYIIYFVLFLVAQILLGVWYRTWALLAGAFSCLLLYTLGFIAAAELSSNPFNDSWFSLYLVGLTVAPALLTQELQPFVEQIVSTSLIPRPFPNLKPRKFLYLAIGLQAFAILFQVIGIAVMAGASSLSTSQAGADVAVVGLVAQILTLTLGSGVCILSAFWIFVRGRGLSSPREDAELGVLVRSTKFKLHIVAMIITLLSMFVATILQAAVIAGGREGQQLRTQNLYYWQGICMAVAIFALTLFHLGFVFKRSGKVAPPAETIGTP